MRAPGRVRLHTRRPPALKPSPDLKDHGPQGAHWTAAEAPGVQRGQQLHRLLSLAPHHREAAVDAALHTAAASRASPVLTPRQYTAQAGGRAHVQPAQQLALDAGAVLQGIPGARLPLAPGVLRPLRVPAGVQEHTTSRHHSL